MCAPLFAVTSCAKQNPLVTIKFVDANSAPSKCKYLSLLLEAQQNVQYPLMENSPGWGATGEDHVCLRVEICWQHKNLARITQFSWKRRMIKICSIGEFGDLNWLAGL